MLAYLSLSEQLVTLSVYHAVSSVSPSGHNFTDKSTNVTLSDHHVSPSLSFSEYLANVEATSLAF
jgi:hypothetical protein